MTFRPNYSGVPAHGEKTVDTLAHRRGVDLAEVAIFMPLGVNRCDIGDVAVARLGKDAGRPHGDVPVVYRDCVDIEIGQRTVKQGKRAA